MFTNIDVVKRHVRYWVQISASEGVLLMAADPSDLCALGAIELGRLYRNGEVSPVEVTQATLERIERLNPELNAFITITADSAIGSARAAEALFLAGTDLGPLQGVPVSVKDCIHLRGHRTTAASRVRMNEPSDMEDATVVERLRQGGGVIVGKTNLHEFAFGDPDPESPFGIVQNPRLIGYHAGGSSSGAASATAAGLGAIAIGTDTAGSIRRPAAACGVYGFKPTHGLVSAYGVIPDSPQHDHVGPLARSVGDIAAALTAIAGWDPRDPFSLSLPPDDYVAALDTDTKNLRLGVATNPEFDLGFPDALALIKGAGCALVDAGMTRVEFAFSRFLDVADILHTALLPVAVSLYHERYRDRRHLYGRHFLEWTGMAAVISGIDHLRALEEQASLKAEWKSLFGRFDIMLLPANVGPTFPQNDTTICLDGVDYPVRRIMSQFNALSNLTGAPSLVVPVGTSANGLPIAVQIIGPPQSERRVLAVGHLLERALGAPVQSWGIEPRHSPTVAPQGPTSSCASHSGQRRGDRA